jgi:hypothetical protein
MDYDNLNALVRKLDAAVLLLEGIDNFNVLNKDEEWIWYALTLAKVKDFYAQSLDDYERHIDTLMSES